MLDTGTAANPDTANLARAALTFQEMELDTSRKNLTCGGLEH